MPTESYPSLATREFQRLKRLVDDAIAQIPDSRFFAQPGDTDNSIAIIVKHVAGNLRSRWTDFLSTDGEKPGRDRDAEFVIASTDSRENLLEAWEAGWSALFSALAPLQGADLERTITIRGEPLTVLQAINRQLTHYAYHAGQIVYLAKHYAGRDWQTLSVPPGRSKQFNETPKRYLDGA